MTDLKQETIKIRSFNEFAAAIPDLEPEEKPDYALFMTAYNTWAGYAGFIEGKAVWFPHEAHIIWGIKLVTDKSEYLFVMEWSMHFSVGDEVTIRWEHHE